MDSNTPIISVSQLNEYVKSYIDSSGFLSKVYVKGEISNFTNHYKTGHFYFTLKDEKAQIKAVMFQSYASRVAFTPDNSMQVLVTGRISVFPRDGVYQLYAESMEPLGKGALYAAFEHLKEKLSAKGYFDSSYKKPLPEFPQKIGIITSPIGAAVADIKNIISRRYPLAEICIYPALVQGEGAAADLCKGILHFDNDSDCDVIIIGRGGGSMEDLWAFNDETLAKTIFECSTPVISAVGHETDFTICDFVSDLRAPTPSAAAELAVPDKNELYGILSALSSRLEMSLSGVINNKKSQLDLLASKKCFSSPAYITEKLEEQIADLDRRITKSTENILQQNKLLLSSVASQLAALNPMNVLARGYAAVFDNSGGVVSSTKKIKKDDTLSLVMSDGKIDVKVL